MIDFELKRNEYIITESEDVIWVSNDGIELDKLVLTNMNIFVLYSEKEGFFSRPKKRRAVMPLDGIRIEGGELMVTHVRNWDYGTCLQIHHAKGKELFHFSVGGKKRAIEWENEINRLFGRGPVKVNTFGSLAAEFTGGLFSAAESAIESLTSNTKDYPNDGTEVRLSVTEPGEVEYYEYTDTEFVDEFESTENVDIPDAEYARAPISTPLYGDDEQSICEESVFEEQQEELGEEYEEAFSSQPAINFCTNCGAKLGPGEKFCSECGSPTGIDAPPPVPR